MLWGSNLNDVTCVGMHVAFLKSYTVQRVIEGVALHACLSELK